MTEVNDWEEVTPSKTKIDDWEEITPKKVSKIEEPTKTQSAIAGWTQGVTLNHADELGGAVQSLADKAYSALGLGAVSDVDAELAKQGFKLPNEGKSVYEQARDESRIELKRLEEANPKSFLGGNFVGGVMATAGVPGAGSLKSIPQALKLAGATGLAGGVDAAGRSDADTLEGVTKDAVIGATTGAGLGIGIPVVGKGLGVLGGAAGELAKKTTKAIAPETYERLAYASNLGKQGIDVFGKESKDILTDKIKQYGSQFKDKFLKDQKTASKRYGEILSDPTTDLTNINQVISNVEDEIMNDSSLGREAKQKALNIFDDFKNKVTTEETVSGRELAVDKLNKNLEKLRGKQDLKGQQYEQFYANPTDEGNFIQGVNARLNRQGTEEVGRSVVQQAIPEDKIIKTTTNELKDLSISELKAMKDKLYNEAKQYRNVGNDLDSNALVGYAKQIDDEIKGRISPDLIGEFGEVSNELRKFRGMEELNPNLELGKLKSQYNIDNTLGTSLLESPMTKISDVSRQLSIPEQTLNEMQRTKSISEAVGAIRNPNTGLKSIITASDKGLMRATNYIQKLRHNGIASKELADKLAQKGSKFAPQLQQISNDPTNREKIIFQLTQNPAFRKELDDLRKEEENNN